MTDTMILLLVLVSMGIVFGAFAAYQARFRKQMFHRRSGVAKWSALACAAAALVVAACIVAANVGISAQF